MNRHTSLPPSLSKLVSAWITVSLFFVSGQAVMSYGVLAGFLIIGAFLTAFLLIIPFLWLSRSKRLVDSFLLSILKKWIHLGSFTIHLLILMLILHASLQYFSSFILISLTVFSVLAVFIFRRKTSTLQTFKLVILLGLAVFLPNYIFLQKGLETVYHNLLHYHPGFLHLEQEGALFFFCLITGAFFAKMFAMIPMLDQYVEQKFSKGIQKIFFGTVIWATIILAFSSMTLVSYINSKPFQQENRLFFDVLGQQMDGIFLMVIIFSLYFSAFIEMFGAATSLIQTKSAANLLYIVIGAISAAYFYLSHVSIILIFLLFGSAACLICLIYLVQLFFHHINIKKRKININ